MSIQLQEKAGTRFVAIDLMGKLRQEDYDQYVPRIEQLIREQGKLRLLVHMHDFHGWTAGALWADLKFEVKHFKDMDRLAFVGDAKWESGMSKFCKLFTTAQTRFFDEAHLEEARAWLETP